MHFQTFGFCFHATVVLRPDTEHQKDIILKKPNGRPTFGPPKPVPPRTENFFFRPKIKTPNS